MRMNQLQKVLLLVALTIFANTLLAQTNPLVTQRVYLSGTGADDMVEWDFFCTGGNNSGEWKKIGVPSCWELQGFGRFQYGIRFYGLPFPDNIANEKGIYKHTFDAPAAWRDKQVILVFEGSMTDTDVRINTRRPGNKHQGGFYRFSYDITDFLKYGEKNQLEVTVSKESENASVNLAERRADYWNFGGIIRPVFLEVRPATNIARVAIDARADGVFRSHFYLNRAVEGLSVQTSVVDSDGKILKTGKTYIRNATDAGSTILAVSNPRQWTAETPQLYTARFSLIDKHGREIHRHEQRFGFRTIEVRKSDGLYINGNKVNIRGVNRHSFRPESGRTLSKAKNIEDVLLIKSMNMNAVRLSHYPADPEFLEACDSLGLYVMNELGGWHGKYDTPTGIPLIRGLVERDVNHPSVIWWANGNEKGWNTELDGEFHKHDPQKRPVIHPQGNFSGFETMHYRSYGETQEYLRLPEIFMPTEFLHGLYDGGHGAGLYDYWEMMRKHPRCAGGFLWVLADEGVKRVDKDGFIDNQGNYGADGIVGPHHEKEGSYYAVKEIWNPVQVFPLSKPFEGRIRIENRYNFLNINTCTFNWKEVKFPSAFDKQAEVVVLRSGTFQGPDIPAQAESEFNIGVTPGVDADALILTVTDYRGEVLWQWSFSYAKKQNVQFAQQGKRPGYKQTDTELIVEAGQFSYIFSKKEGTLKQVIQGSKTMSFGNGPRFIAARRSDRSFDQFYNHDDEKAQQKNRLFTMFEDKAVFTGFTFSEENQQLKVRVGYKLGNLDEVCWTFCPEGSANIEFKYNFSAVVDMMGICFDYPEEKMQHKKWLGQGPFRVWQNRLHGTTLSVWENDYNDPVPGESFTYPEFKGYFAGVEWMKLRTDEGCILIENHTPTDYVGVYQPRDGRDRLLYTLPETGISFLHVIPPVRNKVNATDLIGPSSQPVWANGSYSGNITLHFSMD